MPDIGTDIAEAESLLTPLVRQHGLEAVAALLLEQFYNVNLDNYQTVENIARNIHNRLMRTDNSYRQRVLKAEHSSRYQQR